MPEGRASNRVHYCVLHEPREGFNVGQLCKGLLNEVEVKLYNHPAPKP